MNALFTAKAWCRHLWQGKLVRSLHSPFLFRLFRECHAGRTSSQAFAAIEEERDKLLVRRDLINRLDFGAGGWSGNYKKQPSIGSIARHALSNRHQCHFTAMLAQHLQAKQVLELGTSLGIMSAYLQSGAPHATVTTVEGDPEIAAIAKEVWRALNLDSIHGITSTFEAFIETSEFNTTPWDLVFIDGNHRATAVQMYVAALLPHIHPNAVIVVDDIYWSADMQEGWKQLIQLPAVTQSVDCFRFGMLFFRPDFLAKEHHRIILL